VPLDDLPLDRRIDVLAAVRAVEESDHPVPGPTFRALVDETLRASVEQILAYAGRVLLESATGGGVPGFLSGYDEDVRERLLVHGIGVLPPDDRAVLALVLIHTVAIPRARGLLPAEADWTVAQPVSVETLGKAKIADVAIRNGLRRLRNAKILAFGARRQVVPGPQFRRLSGAVVSSLFEELILLAEPEGLLAESIRRRRTAPRVLPQDARLVVAASLEADDR
jgi:hypothetical protein